MQFNPRGSSRVALTIAAAAAVVGVIYLSLSKGAPTPASLTTFEQPRSAGRPPQDAASPGAPLGERQLMDKAVRDERRRQGEESLQRRDRDAAATGAGQPAK